MKYKGYTGKVEYDEDAGILYGRILGIRDVVDFQASRVDEVEKAFHESVDDYIAFCKERGEMPQKPYSGKLIFRTSPEIHRELSIAAQMQGKSINQLLQEAALSASRL